MFAGVTDYGNLSYTWGRTGKDDFREFLIGLNVEYFGGKMFSGMAYMIHDKKYEKACQRFAQMILPALQSVLKKEIESERVNLRKQSVIPNEDHDVLNGDN